MELMVNGFTKLKPSSMQDAGGCLMQALLQVTACSVYLRVLHACISKVV